jgi:hypothetical protein
VQSKKIHWKLGNVKILGNVTDKSKYLSSRN